MKAKKPVEQAEQAEQAVDQTQEIEEELSLEAFTTILGEIPFVVPLGEGAEYAGPPNKKFAFLVSEEFGMEGCAALLRFANLAMKMAQLGESYDTPKEAKAVPHEDAPLQELIENMEKKNASKKNQDKGTKEKANDK